MSALLLFASILAHEFGHALVARRRGVRIEGIDLWLLGGVARMSGPPKTAGDELSFALAGPVVTAASAARPWSTTTDDRSGSSRAQASSEPSGRPACATAGAARRALCPGERR